jgi:hypothetical protein
VGETCCFGVGELQRLYRHRLVRLGSPAEIDARRFAFGRVILGGELRDERRPALVPCDEPVFEPNSEIAIKALGPQDQSQTLAPKGLPTTPGLPAAGNDTDHAADRKRTYDPRESLVGLSWAGGA